MLALSDEAFAVEYGGGARTRLSYLYEDVLVAGGRWSRSRARTRGRTGTVAARADREHHMTAARAAARAFVEAGGDAALDKEGRANRRLAEKNARAILRDEARRPHGCLCHGCKSIQRTQWLERGAQ